MPTYEQRIKKLKKLQSQPGFKHKSISVSSNKGELNIDLYGPAVFLEGIPPLVEAISKAAYNANMFAALAKANKPLSLIHIENTSSILAGFIREDLPWYRVFSSGKIKQLVIYFNVKGFVKPIDLECRAGKREFRLKKKDGVKFSLGHEFFHLWNYIEPQKVPKKGNIPSQMRSLSRQRELWAVRYTNAWRYKETKCIRRTYGLFNDVVDSISNYK